MPVAVRVLFFGATAETVGERAVDVMLADGSTADAAAAKLLDRYPALKKHKLLFSLNQNYASGREQLQSGDEMAIFTPVSGG